MAGDTKANTLPYHIGNFTEAGRTVTGGVALGFHGVEYNRIEEQVVASSDANIDLDQVIPKDSQVLAVLVSAGGSVTVGGSHVGVGISGNLNAYAEIPKASVDEAGEYAWRQSSALNIESSGKTVKISSTNGSGTGSGNLTGTLNIVILYAKYPSGISASS